MQKLVKKLKKNALRYIVGIVLVAMVVFGITGLIHNANAQSEPGSYVGAAGVAVVYLLFGWILELINMVLGQVLAVVTSILLDVSSFNHFVDIKGIQDAWTVVRDLCNLFFVLALLLISFGTILGLDSYNYKKLMIKFLMMALLINFSLTITGILIDFSQVIMLTFVNAYAHSGAMNIYDALQIGKIFTIEKMGKVAMEGNASMDLLSTVASMGVATVFLGISCLTIGIMAITLIFRVVMLWILAILSPLPYLLSLFPQAGKYGGKWWDMFTRYLIHGPILAFFLWLSLYIATQDATFADLKSVGGDETAVPSSSTSLSMGPSVGITKAGNPEVLIKFVIALGMLLGGLMITKEIGVIGGGLAGKIAAVGFVAWAASKVVQGSVGVLGFGARGAAGLIDTAYKSKTTSTLVNRAALTGFKYYNTGRRMLGMKEAEKGQYLKDAASDASEKISDAESMGAKDTFFGKQFWRRTLFGEGKQSALNYYTASGRNFVSGFGANTAENILGAKNKAAGEHKDKIKAETEKFAGIKTGTTLQDIYTAHNDLETEGNKLGFKNMGNFGGEKGYDKDILNKLNDDTTDIDLGGLHGNIDANELRKQLQLLTTQKYTNKEDEITAELSQVSAEVVASDALIKGGTLKPDSLALYKEKQNNANLVAKKDALTIEQKKLRDDFSALNSTGGHLRRDGLAEQELRQVISGLQGKQKNTTSQYGTSAILKDENVKLMTEDGVITPSATIGTPEEEAYTKKVYAKHVTDQKENTIKEDALTWDIQKFAKMASDNSPKTAHREKKAEYQKQFGDKELPPEQLISLMRLAENNKDWAMWEVLAENGGKSGNIADVVKSNGFEVNVDGFKNYIDKVGLLMGGASQREIDLLTQEGRNMEQILIEMKKQKKDGGIGYAHGEGQQVGLLLRNTPLKAWGNPYEYRDGYYQDRKSSYEDIKAGSKLISSRDTWRATKGQSVFDDGKVSKSGFHMLMNNEEAFLSDLEDGRYVHPDFLKNLVKSKKALMKYYENVGDTSSQLYKLLQGQTVTLKGNRKLNLAEKELDVARRDSDDARMQSIFRPKPNP